MKNQTLSLAFLALAAAGLSTPASAEQFAGESFSFKFSYDPSELDTETSADQMLARLHQEVKLHCIGEFQNKYDRDARQCVSETMTRVVGQIGSTTLASAHAQRMG